MKAKKKLIKKIAKHSERYYVNVHRPEYPDGAIRGQPELAGDDGGGGGGRGAY